MSIIVVFDPGESTGWVAQDTTTGRLMGGTCPKDHLKVAEILEHYKPAEVCIESFMLYPGKAQSLAWNTFYPCEVIGVIKYWCMLHNVPLIEQQPSIKKYAGGFQDDLKLMEPYPSQVITEHTRDAYLHLKYLLLRRKQKTRH